MIISGWKQLAAYTGFHERTLRHWHYTRAKVPFIRVGMTGKHRWIITPDRIYIWLKSLGKRVKNEEPAKESGKNN